MPYRPRAANQLILSDVLVLELCKRGISESETGRGRIPRPGHPVDSNTFGVVQIRVPTSRGWILPIRTPLFC